MDHLLPLPTDEVESMIRGVRTRRKFRLRGDPRSIALHEQENLTQDLWRESVDGSGAVLKPLDHEDYGLQSIRGFRKLYKCPEQGKLYTMKICM